MATEPSVDQPGEREADDRLEQDRPEYEMGGGLHRRPNVRVGENGRVVVQADILDDRIGAVGPVIGEDSWIVQINGKILIASSRMIVGEMNSQAMAVSDRPRIRPARAGGVALAAVSAILSNAVAIVTYVKSPHPALRHPPPRNAGEGKITDFFLLPVLTGRRCPEGPKFILVLASRDLLDLAFFLEDRRPVLDQLVERFLGRALVGHDIVMQPLLRRLHQRGISRLLPEVLDARYRLQEVGGEGLRLGKLGSLSTALWQE